MTETELEGRLNRIRAAVLSDPVFREDGAKGLRDFLLRETDLGGEGVVEGFVPVAETGRCAACGRARNDPLSSTGGAGRTYGETDIRVREDEIRDLRNNERDLLAELRLLRGRIRVLEEALAEVCAMNDAQVSPRAKTKLRASLAAVAVEDGGNDLGYETRSARPVPAGEGADVEGESCQRCGEPYDYVWWCFDPKLWEHVTGHAKPPGDNAPGLLCIPCFDALARERACWLEWAPLNLRHLERHPRCGAMAAGTLAAEPPLDPEENELMQDVKRAAHDAKVRELEGDDPPLPGGTP